jgi:hypothetical protein
MGFRRDIRYVLQEHGGWAEKTVTFFLGEVSMHDTVQLDVDHSGFAWITLDEQQPFPLHGDMGNVLSDAAVFLLTVQ